ncbi:ATP-dependent RNA helicase DeaD [Saccharicrinis carchari]|uniref:ATP-dependent RNA helicase DeaD n=1 Tax=Saccharicrinis carchari TaxID=1168039 RepID=A0A521AQ68_SACCC|nr:DEAD/DEAH box helicase [Saccharicrinis carchari]SMO36790.1 ATP-dependent RNA helicase DeaD [Saccharicrinis carchari]
MITFEEIGLSPEILKAVAELGFVNPTPIQEKTIPGLRDTNQDLVALAQTGTGKTAAFGLPIIEKLEVSNNSVQALVLCPTRELALQITKDIKAFGKYVKGLQVTAVYGGADISKQIKDLKRGTHIVVGTPGRVNDLTRRGLLKMDKLQWLVLDEADEMLNMGFKEELDAIIETTPDNRQSLLFSATMPREIESMAKRYLTDPMQIKIGKQNAGATTVEHIYYMVHARDRYLALKRIADINPDIYCIVFCRTRQETKEVAEKLMTDGYNADALHGDLSQAQRDQVMHRFRGRNLQILVATDVAARGIDVNDLTHVINYNLPDDIEAYTHRSGRTGRAGKTGISIAIIHTKESGRVKMIERNSGIKFERKMIPTGNEICGKQLLHLTERLENVEVNHSEIEEFLPQIIEKFEALDKEELIKRFVSAEFNRFLAYYQDAKDLNVYKKDVERGSRVSGGRRGNDNYARVYLNIGKAHEMTPQRLMGLVNESTNGMKVGFGKIEVLRNFSFFEVEEGTQTDVINSVIGKDFEGEKLHAEIASPRPSDNTGRRRREGAYSKKGGRGQGGYASGRSTGGYNKKGGRADDAYRSKGGGTYSGGKRRR